MSSHRGLDVSNNDSIPQITIMCILYIQFKSIPDSTSPFHKSPSCASSTLNSSLSQTQQVLSGISTPSKLLYSKYLTEHHNFACQGLGGPRPENLWGLKMKRLQVWLVKSQDFTSKLFMYKRKSLKKLLIKKTMQHA